jgi:hypothetical protein
MSGLCEVAMRVLGEVERVLAATERAFEIAQDGIDRAECGNLTLPLPLLVLSPEAMAARMLQGIERREPLVLVGRDAAQGVFLRWPFPAGDWNIMARTGPPDGPRGLFGLIQEFP